MDKPTPRLKGESGNLSDGFENEECIGYDAILSKFHNPFEKSFSGIINLQI